ncbi:MAG: hypothetical protein Kow00127_07820 [Bacteroidales bacterium]
MSAQNQPWTSTTAMKPYVELANPISLNNGIPWDQNSVFPIFFNFEFSIYNHTYNSINVDAGGGIIFPGNPTKSLRVYHTPFGGYMLKDKGDNVSLSDISYEVEGVEGEYIIKIQWKNAGFVQWYSTSDTSDFVDFSNLDISGRFTPGASLWQAPDRSRNLWLSGSYK